jgi:beta-N-acetylhexosaminidase
MNHKERPGAVRYAGLPLAAVLAVSGCVRVFLKPNLALEPDGARWVAKMMRTMSLEDKVAQMVACRYAGNFYPADSDERTRLRDLVVNHKVGGMIIFGGDAYETVHLNNALQQMAATPLLIASDFERGAGNQITGATLFPTIMGIGAADSVDLAYEMGKATALEGRALGVHMTYAPVVDVNINPDNPIINTRAVGEDPEQVSRLAVAFIKGCQDNGMIATAKHFPGHGDTDQDSHILLPVIKADRERMDKVELFPYRKAIAAGVGAVMIAHLVVPALDPTPDLPATLSRAIQAGLLRKEYGFNGLIVTDAMEMGGVTNAYSNTDAAEKAILAGVDMVLLPVDPVHVVPYLRESARTGRIPAARINESARRIFEAKARLGLHRNRLVDVEALPMKIGGKTTAAQALRTFEGAATLVKNDGDVLPFPKEGRKIAVFSLSSDPGDYYAGRAFAAAIRSRSPEAQVFYADGDTGQESLDEALGKASEADVFVCALFSSLSAWKGSVGLSAKHVALIKKLAEGDKPVVVLSFGSPYFLRDFPEVDAYLCFYRNQPQTQAVAARAIFGEIELSGKLPVSLPGLFPAGHGLRLKK